MELRFIFAEIQQGNRTVFKKLFDQFFEELVHYANHYLKNMEQSEDVVQEVFIYIWQNADKLNVRISVKGYLYTMVKHRCINILKSLKITDDLEYIDFHIAVLHEYDPLIRNENAMEKIVFSQAVAEMINTFPAQMQQVFKLWFYNDYNYRAIAEEMEVSVSTVKTYLKRAQNKIAESLPLSKKSFP